ncbi:MAG: M4 family metallopeptidase, partial [Nocardioides sp.]
MPAEIHRTPAPESTQSDYHPVLCIVPRHILRAILRNGDRAQRASARRTLAQDRIIRARRAELADGPARTGVAESLDHPDQLAAPPRKVREIYDCRNRTDLPGTRVRDEGGPATGDVDVDRVYDGLGATWDLYFDVFGRNSYDGKGSTMKGSVHYDRDFRNAMWDGSRLVFGDGDGTIWASFTADVDVIGHELAHGVTRATSNLKYQNQSGALNEHLSDVFGSMVKQRSATPPQTAAVADWLIGDNVFAAGVNATALRSMIAPGTAYNDPMIGADPQPDHMSGLVTTSGDNGGVHINSGIPNRAFVVFAQALGGFAWERAGRVWFATATAPELDENADFATFAALTTDYAFALFGHDVARSCVDAWAKVGLDVPWNRHVDRSAAHGAPTATGSPTAVVLPGLGVQNIAYRDGNGHLHELWRAADGTTGTSDLTALASAPAASGDPFAYADHTRNTEILLFRGGGDRVRSLYWSTGPVGHDDLSGTAGAPDAAGTPVGYHYAPADMHHVIYRGHDDHLHLLAWAGVAPVFYGGNLTGTIDAPPAAGDPAAYAMPDGTNIVPYRADDGRILSVYWKDGPSGLDDLSGTAGTPSAASDPVAFYRAATDTHYVFYRATDGHVYELSWVGVAPVIGRNVTATAGAPPASDKPTAFYSPVHNLVSVIYRRDDGHLHELWWTPGDPAVSHGDITANASAPDAEG